jgi:hypothetical protein
MYIYFTGGSQYLFDAATVQSSPKSPPLTHSLTHSPPLLLSSYHRPLLGDSLRAFFTNLISSSNPLNFPAEVSFDRLVISAFLDALSLFCIIVNIQFISCFPPISPCVVLLLLSLVLFRFPTLESVHPLYLHTFHYCSKARIFSSAFKLSPKCLLFALVCRLSEKPSFLDQAICCSPQHVVVFASECALQGYTTRYQCPMFSWLQRSSTHLLLPDVLMLTPLAFIPITLLLATRPNLSSIPLDGANFRRAIPSALLKFSLTILFCSRRSRRYSPLAPLLLFSLFSNSFLVPEMLQLWWQKVLTFPQVIHLARALPQPQGSS